MGKKNEKTNNQGFIPTLVFIFKIRLTIDDTVFVTNYNNHTTWVISPFFEESHYITKPF